MVISFTNETGVITQEELEISTKLAEAYFETKADPDQLQVEDVTLDLITRVFPHSMNIIKDERRIVGDAFTLPATEQLMQSFTSGAYTEREMFFEIRDRIRYEDCSAIYLCSAFLHSDYRGLGLATHAFVDSVQRIEEQTTHTPALFYWAFSNEGARLAKRVSRETKLPLFARQE